MTWARSHVYMSPDLVHDQPFAEYVTTKVIEQYKAKFALEGRTLKHVHIWSDGCKGQFKNKDQFLFVTQVFPSYVFTVQVEAVSNQMRTCHRDSTCSGFESRTTFLRAATEKVLRTAR